MSIWTIGWLVWIAFFLVWEGAALWNDREKRSVMDTLSQHVWLVLRVGPYGKNYDSDKDGIPDPVPGYTKFMRFALLTLLAWVAVHFMTGGWV